MMVGERERGSLCVAVSVCVGRDGGLRAGQFGGSASRRFGVLACRTGRRVSVLRVSCHMQFARGPSKEWATVLVLNIHTPANVSVNASGPRIYHNDLLTWDYPQYASVCFLKIN